ncbi:MAG: hypothetical protein P8Y71_08520 [Pseudolabrys sp.]|jgi:hypothetical protein
MPEVNVPINWANVDWVYVILLTVFVFLAALIGNLLSFNHRGWGALLSALLFAVAFVFWSYYPHHLLSLPTRLSGETAQEHEPAGMPTTPEAGTQKPANPVQDVTPPKNPVTTVKPPQ